MLDDPSEPAIVRDLLRAGVDDEVRDYDFDQGLARHMAIVAAGTPPPPWAEQLSTGAGSGGSTAAGTSAAAGTGATAGAGAAASAGITLKTTALILGLPLASAGVVAAVVLGTAEPREPVAKAPGVAVSQQARPSAPVSQPVSPLAAIDGDEAEPSLTGAEPGGPRIVTGEEPSRAVSAASRSKRSGRAQHRRRVQAHEAREAALADTRYETSEPATHEGLATTSRAASGTAQEKAPLRNDLHARWARGEKMLEQERAKSGAEAEPSRTALDRRTEVERKAAEPAVDPLTQEMRMLANANNLLATDPERALAIARSGERNYPNSMFTEERRHIIILALVKLGRMQEARALAWPYLRQYPRGPFSERIRRALATGEVR